LARVEFEARRGVVRCEPDAIFPAPTAGSWGQKACTPQVVVVIIRLMKQYVVDQLRYPDYEKLKAFLDHTYGEAPIGQVYWVPVDPGLLTPVQNEHKNCQPHVAAVELQEDRVSMELLVRTLSRIRCACIAYATEEQRTWLIRLLDRMLMQLNISV
jgi:hypothetical protein